MTRTPVEVPEALFAQLREIFNEPQRVELTATSPGKITGRALIMRSVSRAKASAREPSARCRWARLIGLSGSVRVRLQRARQKIKSF